MKCPGWCIGTRHVLPPVASGQWPVGVDGGGGGHKTGRVYKHATPFIKQECVSIQSDKGARDEAMEEEAWTRRVESHTSWVWSAWDGH